VPYAEMLRFRNKSANAITSDGPSAIGEPDRTWIRVVDWKDYVLTSSGGGRCRFTFTPARSQAQTRSTVRCM
jgi:hypothetical protein